MEWEWTNVNDTKQASISMHSVTECPRKNVPILLELFKSGEK